MLVEDIVGNLAGLVLSPEQPGRMQWSPENETGKTNLDAKLQVQDFGRTMEQLAFQKTIETSGGEFDLLLDWPGGPQDFSLESLRGSLGVEIADGRFLNTPAARCCFRGRRRGTSRGTSRSS